jgi:hypothetical protein
MGGLRVCGQRAGDMGMREREWLIPGIILTAVSGSSALIAIPNYTGLVAALMIYPAWIAAAAVIGSLCLLVRMARLKVERPMREMWRMAVEDWNRFTRVTAIVLVAGLNMISFMWIKPLLNYLVPFWADPYLAQLDYLLFFGHDPWTLLIWLNQPGAAFIYHPMWFGTMILALILVAWAPMSPERSAIMLAYFVLWSVVGPVLHSMLPAAGPIFYERIGHGDRFAGLQEWPETRQVSDYLWTVYASREFGAGSGISAMPSLHVTIATWVAISARLFARWLALPAILFATMIFLLSVALGWHYAVDGVLGALCALGCYFGLLAWFRQRQMGRGSSEKQVPTLQPIR